MNNDLETITNLFEKKEIRSVWDSEKEDYYFSVVDVISALTDASIPRNYWSDLKRKIKKEGSELHENIVQLKLKSNKDGKYYLTDVLDTEGILRLIESVPSPKAEPFKLWLAHLGKDRIDEVFDPTIAIERSINYYRNKGYDDSWIENRIRTIIHRKQLTDVWKEHGVNTPKEYAMLTNEIYKCWSKMNAKKYKDYKGLRKENLRDNMSDLELLLTDIGEVTTKEFVNIKKPTNYIENKMIARKGGNIANETKNNIEEELGMPIVSKNNNLNYKYKDNNLLNNTGKE